MSSSPKLAKRKILEETWEQFINLGKLDQNIVDSTIYNSWQRCRVATVNPIGGTCNRVHEEEPLKQLIKSNKMLIEVATPVIELVYHTVQGSGFMLVLVNNEGIVLKTMGDYKTLSDAENLNFYRGADWTEESVGTNAIGTCLAAGMPIQVTGAEHFCTGHHAWTCSAAPIRSPGGQVWGCLDMSGPYDKMHPHTLGMIVAAARDIEGQLRREMTRKELTSPLNQLLTALNTVSEGIIHINIDGIIIDANVPACNMIGLPLQKLKGLKVEQALGNDISGKQLQAACTNGKGELIVKTVTGSYCCSAREIANKENKFYGSILILRETQADGRLGKISPGLTEIGDNIGVNNKNTLPKRDMTTGTGRTRFSFADIIGSSKQIQAVVELAQRAAACSSTVLLAGESGCGKEVFAQAIHSAGHRAKGPFVPVNCASMPVGLIQSELFGYSDGAFTGASRGGQPGKFELAHGGTLFLDEIGDMPLEMQPSLLRVLQEKTVMRVGGKKVIPVDVRVIAATNKDLRQEVRKGNFREDLFYRINVLSIAIPPLRARTGDLELMIKHFLDELPAKVGNKAILANRSARDILMRYQWPGNVRELVNVLEQAFILADDGIIKACHLPPYLTEAQPKPVLNQSQPTTLAQLEMHAIKETLSRCRGNISRTARVLGIGRNTLYDKIKKYDITTQESGFRSQESE